MALGTGKLRAATNRVRTSLANQTNEIWTDLIGIQQSKDAGTNTAIEASLSAPGKIGGSGVNVGKRQKGGIKGDEAIIHPTEALVALARLHGAGAPDTVIQGDRGVCRKCGGVGHLTSMCKNTYALLKDDGAEEGLDGSDLDSDSSSSSKDRKRKRRKSKKKTSKKKSSKKRKHESSDSEEPKKKKNRKSKKKKSKKSRKSSSSSSSSDSESDS